jgi:hypothetical protein
MNLEPYRKAAGDLTPSPDVQLLVSWHVNDAESERLAVEALRWVKAKAKELDTRRKTVTGPLRAAAKEVDGWFKPALEALKAAEERLKDELVRFHFRKPEANAAAILEAQAAATPVEAHAALSRVAEESMPAGTHTRRTKRWEVVDFDLLPRDYLVPDEIAIRNAVNKGIEVPGVRVWTEESVVVR